MDGRGCVLDNAFIERFRRTVKYEEIYLNHYDSVWELEDRLPAWFDFHCNRRRHSALNYRCPAELFFGSRVIRGGGTRFSSLIYPPRGINQGQDALRYNPVYCPGKWGHLKDHNFSGKHIKTFATTDALRVRPDSPL